jgi:hypothetical protein
VSDSASIFSQPERRSYLVPILLALAALAVAIAIAIHFFPATSVNMTAVRTDVLAQDTTFKGSTVIGVTDTAHTLLVVTKLHVDNQTRVPIYVDDFHLTIDTPQGSEATAIAAQKQALPDLQTNFPKLVPLLTDPLLRNTAIDPGKTAEGTIVFSLNLRKEVWDQRQSATLRVDLYHLPPTFIAIPKDQ